MSTTQLFVGGVAVLSVLVAAVSAPAQTNQPVNLTVNTSVRYQTIDGFGTALASESPTWTPQMQSLYTQDLGASMLRVPLSPDVLPAPISLGPDMQSNINLFNFNDFPQNVWGQFAAAVTQQKIDQMKVIGTIWSPPPWMKDSNNVNGGSLLQDPNNLQQFARYVASYVQGFQQSYGVPLYAVSIQNELRFSEPYPSTVYNPTQYVAALKAVGAEFAADGITTKIFGPEDVGVDSGYLTDNQMSFINAVKADPQASQYLNIYAVHGYSGNGVSPRSSRTNWADYYNRIKSDGLPSWMTEESGEHTAWISTDPQSKQPNGALSVALHVHEGLTYGNLNAWLYWQLDDGNAVPTDFTLTGDSSPGTLKYNAIKHYFRYIRPGDVRLDAGPDNATGVNVDAWMDDSSNTLAINLINMSATDEPTNISIPGTLFSSFAQYRTSATEPWAVLPDVGVNDGTLSLTLPADSVVTLVSDGISGALPEPGAALLLAGGGWMLLRRRRANRCRRRSAEVANSPRVVPQFA